MGIRVVTDSSACLPPCLADELDITVVNLHTMGHGDESSTSGLTALELCATYARQLERGGDAGVIAVHLSKELSSTWSAASTAAGVFDDRVRVVDTDSTGMVIGAAAIAAARAAQEGKSLDECEAAAAAITGHSHLWLYVHKIDSLRKSGRMTTGASLMSSALPFKLLFELRDGAFSVAARTRTQMKAIEKLVATVVDTVGQQRAVVSVHSTGTSDIAETVADDLRRHLPLGSGVLEVRLSEALEVHTGPGAVAVSVVFPTDLSDTVDGALDDTVDDSQGSDSDVSTKTRPEHAGDSSAEQQGKDRASDSHAEAGKPKKRSKRETMKSIGADAARQLKLPKSGSSAVSESAENAAASDSDTDRVEAEKTHHSPFDVKIIRSLGKFGHSTAENADRSESSDQPSARDGGKNRKKNR